MSKQQLIERYGIEWYEQLLARKRELYWNDPEVRKRENTYAKAHNNLRYQTDPDYREAKKTRQKERYRNDSEYRESCKAQNRTYWKARYVKGGRFDLIENYDKALKDNFEGWTIHHRLEIHDDYVNTRHELIIMNLYYNRPPEELIWLRLPDHIRMHNIVRNNKLLTNS